MTFSRLPVLLSTLLTFSVACGGGGAAGGSSGAGGTAGTGGTGGTGGGVGTVLVGVPLPSEISALPTTATTPAALPRMMATSHPLASASVLPGDSDYARAVTSRFVSEQSLNQFDILNTIFDAMAQTHYADEANLNKGPYAAIVSWVERNKDQEEKRLVKWVVDSSRASANDPNVVKTWFRMPMKDNQPHVIQAKVVITTAPTQNADGSYGDYGVWSMQVKLLDPMPFQFAASAERDAQGRAVVKMGQLEPSGLPNQPHQTRGILVKSATSGAGKVTYPDFQSCMSGPPCPQQQVAYVYDASDVTMKKGDSAPENKSRGSFVDVVNRYGLYDATTGADVGKSRTFGFPIRATVQGSETFGYYGAWQGRHQLWANGSQLPASTTVSKADVPPGQTAPTYTTSPAFTGILVRRSYAQAQLSDLTGLVVETWDNESFQLGFDGTSWCKSPTLRSPLGSNQLRASCVVPAGLPPGTPQPVPFTNLASLYVAPADMRRNVMINVPPTQPWTPGTPPPPPEQLVYEVAGPQGEGFYPAVFTLGLPHPTRTSDVMRVLQAGDFFWVNVGGPVYISYDGSLWVQKKLDSFDETTWTPTFAPAEFDQPYTLQAGREYYFNNSGTNYVVQVDAQTSLTDVKLEIQSVAHPWDAAAFVPAGTVFRQQYCGQGTCSTFAFGTDPGSKFMKLTYATVAGSDASSNKAQGDLVETGMWGLQADIGGQTVSFNWEYPPPGQQGGVQQFLLSGGAYVQLDDPIRLDAVSLTNGSGTRSFTLQFDGNWMQGLPNVWDELRRSNFVVTEPIKQKVFSIPSGHVIGAYIAKQLQVSQYMAPSSAAPLDLAEALAIDLSTIPAYADNGMGPVPDPAPLKYSEGKPIQP